MQRIWKMVIFYVNFVKMIVVLKPGLDGMVRSGKPWTAHFCGSFSLKNRSMGKKQGPVRIAVGPHGSQNRDQTAFHGSLLPFESKPKKKKKVQWNGHYRPCMGFPVRPGLFAWKYSLQTCRKFWIFHRQEGHLVC